MAILTRTRARVFKTASVGATALAIVSDDLFTADEIAAKSLARITTAAEPVRYRYDGGEPTAAVGHLLAANSETILIGLDNVAGLVFIRAGSADAEVSITLEG